MDTTGFYPLGQQINGTRLTPVKLLSKHQGKRALFYKCQCECGKTLVTQPYYIQHGRTKSCGCLKTERARAAKTHGLSHRPEYGAAKNAFDRCTNPKSKYFHLYGGRGIRVEFASVDEFVVWLVKNLPKPNGRFVLDRSDNDGHYSKSNLKWSTPKESSRNNRANRKVTIGGVTRLITEWSEISGIGTMTIHTRIKEGFPEELWLHNGKITKSLLFQKLHELGISPTK